MVAPSGPIFLFQTTKTPLPWPVPAKIAVSEDGVAQILEEVPYFVADKMQVHTGAVNPSSLRQHIMTPRARERYTSCHEDLN